MEEFEQIKCKNCGFVNIKGTKTCSRCHTNVDSARKSCPRCGKVNANNVKKCVNCRFDFTKKRKSIFFYLVLSLLIVGVLLLLTYLDYESIVDKFSFGLRVIAGFIVFAIVLNIFTYGSKDKINYAAEDEMIDNHKKLDKMKKFSNIAVIIGGIIVFIVLIVYYFVL